jgi:hypothetical protein
VFQNHLNIFFPNVYDIKTISPMLSPIFESGGLNRLADSMNIQRIGNNHQAGSDSLTTSKVFFKLKQQFPSLFNQVTSENNGDIYGYSNDQTYYRPVQTSVQPSSSIQITDSISNVYDDQEILAADGVYNIYDYDNYTFNAVNPNLVGPASHTIDINYNPQGIRNGFSHQPYHASQSMHVPHEHIVKNHHLPKLQSQNLVDPLSFVPPAMARGGLHLTSSAQPLLGDP